MSRNKIHKKERKILISAQLIPDGSGDTIKLGFGGVNGPRLFTKEGDLHTKNGKITKYYERENGKNKVVSQYIVDDISSNTAEMALFNGNDVFYVIDTNTDIKHSLSACAIATVKQNYITGENDVFFESYVFNNSSKYPSEKIAIKNLIHHIELTTPDLIGRCITIVTDHDLGFHMDYNNLQKPFIGDYFIPSYIKLFYASSESIDDPINKIINECDKIAARKLSKFIQNLNE